MQFQKITLIEIVAALVLASIGFTVTLIMFPGLGSQEAAAWIQAIGSVAAVVAAILIMKFQHTDARIQRLEEDERRRMQILRGLHTEMSLLSIALRRIRDEIQKFYDINQFAIHNNHQMIVIFDSVHESVLTVSSDVLRSEIIRYYSAVRSVVRELEIHTDRVKSFKTEKLSELEKVEYIESLRDDQTYIIETVNELVEIKKNIDLEMCRLAIIL